MARQNQIKHDSNARQDERMLALRMRLGWEGYGLYWGIVEILSASANYECVKDYNRIAFDLRVGANIVKSLVEDFGLFTFTDDGKRFYSEVLSEDDTLDNLQEAVEDITASLRTLEDELLELREYVSKNEEEKELARKRRSEAARKAGLASGRARQRTNVERTLNERSQQEKAPLSSPLKESSPVPPKEIYPPIIPQKEVCDKGARKDFCETAESKSSVEPKQEASACADILPPPPPPVENAKRTIFVPPTEAEVAEYAKAKGYADFETERFVDFYASKGWYVGKNKMKDWKAAVRNWWRGQKDRNNRINQTSNGTDKYANRRGREGTVAPAESFANWDGRF